MIRVSRMCESCGRKFVTNHTVGTPLAATCTDCAMGEFGESKVGRRVEGEDLEYLEQSAAKCAGWAESDLEHAAHERADSGA